MASNPLDDLRQYRFVLVDDLESDPGLLDEFPGRYVYVAAKGVSKMRVRPGNGSFGKLFSCVEALEERGWQVVAWDLELSPYRGAIMRRVKF